MKKGEKKNLFRKMKRPPLVAAMIVTLLLIVVLITTMAMFASKDLITNTFKSGSIDIELLEPSWDPSAAKNIVPGTQLEKDPKIKNVDELDAYVFLRVTIPAGLYQIENNTNEKGKKITEGNVSVPLYKFIAYGNYIDDTTFDQTVRTANWTLVEHDGSDTYHYYVYGYKGNNTADGLQRLPKDGITEPLFDSVILTNINEVGFDEDRNYSIKVEAFGIQADYLGMETNLPQTVWERIKSD